MLTLKQTADNIFQQMLATQDRWLEQSRINNEAVRVGEPGDLGESEAYDSED